MRKMVRIAKDYLAQMIIEIRSPQIVVERSIANYS